MIKYIMISIAVMSFILMPYITSAEVYKCEASRKWQSHGAITPDKHPDYKIGIWIPDKFTSPLNVFLANTDGKSLERIGPETHGVYKGKLEIKDHYPLTGNKEVDDQLKKARSTYKYDLIVTRLPDADGGRSLMAFASEGEFTLSLRLDVWDKDMPLFIYESGANEFIVGKCK